MAVCWGHVPQAARRAPLPDFPLWKAGTQDPCLGCGGHRQAGATARGLGELRVETSQGGQCEVSQIKVGCFKCHLP